MPVVEKLLSDPKMPHHPQAFTLWNYLQSGILPYAGGILEQPAWYIEDMGYIDILREWESIPFEIEANAKHLK